MASWPDGVPVHDRLMFVRLACGHSRFSRGWRGDAGERYCCDVCHVMTTIVEARERVTGETPIATPWRPPCSLHASDQVRWGLEYIRRRYGERYGRQRWRARSRLVLRVGRLRVRVVWRWNRW